jgi:S1-C subfamily serine protease
MRAGIGLISLLLAVGLIFYLFAESEIPKIQSGEEAREQVKQISGYGPAGEAAGTSFDTQGQLKGSRLDNLLVLSVTPGGAMDSYFGLRSGDEITAINGMRINDISNSDEETAKALATEAFSRKQKLTVRRNGQTIDLPLAPGTATAPPAPSPAQPPAASPPAPPKSRGLQGQLEAIQGAGGAEPAQDQ